MQINHNCDYDDNLIDCLKIYREVLFGNSIPFHKLDINNFNNNPFR